MRRSEFYREGRVPLHTLRAEHRLRLLRGQDHVRPHRREGLDLQGRRRPNSAERRAPSNAAASAGNRPRPRRVADRPQRRGGERAGRGRAAAAVPAAPLPRPTRRAAEAAAEPPRPPERRADHADPPQGQAPQAAPPRAARGMAKGGTAGGLRRVRHPGARAGLRHQPADRVGSYRDHPPHQAWRQGLDQHLPGPSADQEAGRDPHGFR